ncbi:hypothetical protein AC1031_002748 [Aphanomyces cochlioides]|nr:hypothetical protein AC1031_002748 [Aphanomyces cochlioides]
MDESNHFTHDTSVVHVAVKHLYSECGRNYIAKVALVCSFFNWSRLREAPWIIVMEGNGVYNRVAVCQMGLVDKTNDLLQVAMARFAKHAPTKSTYNIADLGASQGRNSLQLIHQVLAHLGS